MNISLKKYNGIGNDFIIIEPKEGLNVTEFAIQACNRETGVCKGNSRVGADGLIVVEKKDDLFYMRIINPDGSEPQMCGNGLRCMAAYLYDTKKIIETQFEINTKAGIKPVVCKCEGSSVKTVTVDMGAPIYNRAKEIKDENKVLKGREVSMGNPHFVLEYKEVDTLNLKEIGPRYASNPEFEETPNIEFVKINSKNNVQMRVWERGAGETQACGTGACAVVVALASDEKLDANATVELPGGNLYIEWTKKTVMMTGGVEYEYETVWEVRRDECNP